MAAVFLTSLYLPSTPIALGQKDQVLAPKQSAAVAKQIIEAGIDALGGSAYLNVQNVTCTGRLGQFNHAGELIGVDEFVDYMEPPLKDRQEYLPNHNNIQVFDGDNGWYGDVDGVTVAPKADVAQFRENVQKDLGYILRQRIHDPDMVFRYGSSDSVDLQRADWVELVDADHRTMRIAFANATHLPIRKSVVSLDPDIQLKNEEIEYYSNYRLIDGIQTPFQITRERNGTRVSQIIYTMCNYNANIPDSLFSKESLDQRWSDAKRKGSEKEK